MKRSCIILPIDDYIKELNIYNNKNITLYIDSEKSKDCEEIIKFIGNNEKKFKTILIQILSGRYNDHLYKKENVGSGTEDITAMKFSGVSNKRIYCKEFFKDNKKIVMVTLFSKKVQKNKEDKKLTNRLKIIGDYEYEFK